MTRLAPQPGELIDRRKSISFSFDGKSVDAFVGDTIGSALYAQGRRTFSRSFKYHRRRGLMCCAGNCPNCLVAVDGAPGVRACTEPARQGARVEHLNASPGLEHDVMSLTDAVGGPFTPPGFYYKTFIRPRRLWPLYEKLLRHATGLGRLPSTQTERSWRTEYRRRHADLLVVGGGLAGLRAAIAAAERGADVVLADDGPEPGGRLLWEGAHAQAREAAARARELGVELLASAPALGHFDGIVPVWQGSTLHQVRARHHIFATGAIEQPLVFAGNDLPGVMLSSGARRLIGLYSVKPGTRAVLATTSDRGLEAALALARLGISVAAVADLRAAPSALAPALQAAGIELLQGWTVTATRGRREVQGAVLAPLAGAAGHAGATAQAGTTARAGTKRPDKAFVCFCEDVTTKDIARAVAEGYESIELCKRFTTVTMGPCQGRMCQLSAVRLMAQETGQSLAQVGTTTSRPPWSTVPLGAFAGRPIEPAKRSSIHPRHRALGARIRWAGDWRSAYDYGDPEGEALAVHRSAGLIDVSTLGAADQQLAVEIRFGYRLSRNAPASVGSRDA